MEPEEVIRGMSERKGKHSHVKFYWLGGKERFADHLRFGLSGKWMGWDQTLDYTYSRVMNPMEHMGMAQIVLSAGVGGWLMKTLANRDQSVLVTPDQNLAVVFYGDFSMNEKIGLLSLLYAAESVNQILTYVRGEAERWVAGREHKG